MFSLIIQGNIILVDVLGIRGSVNVTDKLIEDLPNAMLFIFVINGGSVGGMQNDRVYIQLSNLILIIFYRIKQKLNKNILLVFFYVHALVTPFLRTFPFIYFPYDNLKIDS